jgi:hypothetical protein
MPFPLLLARSFFRIFPCLSRFRLLTARRAHLQEDDTDDAALAGGGGLGDGLTRQGRAAAAVVDEIVGCECLFFGFWLGFCFLSLRGERFFEPSLGLGREGEAPATWIRDSRRRPCYSLE